MKLAANTPIPATRELKPGGAHETNYHQRMANLCREEYARTYALKEAMVLAHVSGFLDVTVRSTTSSVTIPFIGEGANQRAQNLYIELAEMLSDKLSRLERDIVSYEQDSETDEADEREGMGSRAETFAFCLPMRPFSNEEFLALPVEARRAYDEHRAENINQLVKGGQAA